MHHRFGRLTKNGRSLFLAYDHGLEHGPGDFTLESVNPENVIDIAAKGGYTGVILNKGLAKSYRENYSGKVPLILKLTGRTNLTHGEPYAPVVCSLKEAAEFGVSAVAHTIYIGSEHEAKMFEDFRHTEEEARNFGIPIIAFMRSGGRAVPNPKSTDAVAYSARAGIELGADMVAVPYTGTVESFQWVVKCAGRAHVLAFGGPKQQVFGDTLSRMHGALAAGASGLAIGRNVWQSENPAKASLALNKIVFETAFSFARQQSA